MQAKGDFEARFTDHSLRGYTHYRTGTKYRAGHEALANRQTCAGHKVVSVTLTTAEIAAYYAKRGSTLGPRSESRRGWPTRRERRQASGLLAMVETQSSAQLGW
jgi:hypothetical protein